MAGKRTGYVKVSIKKELLEPVEEFIKENPQLGYRSLAQFIEDAIRRRADELHIFERLYIASDIPLGIEREIGLRRARNSRGWRDGLTILREIVRTILLEERKKEKKK